MSKDLSLKSLKVLKTKSDEATNYLVGDNYLIYNNQLIKEVNTKGIIVLNQDILKTATHLINNGEKLDLAIFPFEIKIAQ